MNAYLQWHYCDKISDSADCDEFPWRYENDGKKNNHPRKNARVHGITKFNN